MILGIVFDCDEWNDENRKYMSNILETWKLKWGQPNTVIASGCEEFIKDIEGWSSYIHLPVNTFLPQSEWKKIKSKRKNWEFSDNNSQSPLLSKITSPRIRTPRNSPRSNSNSPRSNSNSPRSSTENSPRGRSSEWIFMLTRVSHLVIVTQGEEWIKLLNSYKVDHMYELHKI